MIYNDQRITLEDIDINIRNYYATSDSDVRSLQLTAYSDSQNTNTGLPRGSQVCKVLLCFLLEAGEITLPI